ncbi:MAG: histidine kinase [Gammaproteobacteria bacterium]|nr:histidine kinase [Gammaproteobacteria bacterium]
MLVLSPTSSALLSWSNLALTSVFVQWVGLTSAGSLCALRPVLGRLSNLAAGVWAYLLVLAITAAWTGLLVYLAHIDALDPRLLGATPRNESFWFAQSPLQNADGQILGLDDLSWLIELFVRNLGIAGIVAAVALRYLYIQFQWKRQMEAEAEARIQALQSRIRPHFLFNSMNTIASFTRTQPELAEEVVEDLADLFRASLSEASIDTTLGAELELCRQYVRIESLRLGERLQAHWNIGSDVGAEISTDHDVESADPRLLGARVPSLLLQPLIENAIYHGIEPSAGGGEVWVRIALHSSRVRVEIENTLSANRDRVGHQMGQANVRERMLAFFAGQAQMVTKDSGDRYLVTLEFPIMSAVRP